jgi:hypothetical protein
VTLFQALGLNTGDIAAVVGAGGKSTVVERLRAEASSFQVAELHDGESLPPGVTVIVAVAGLDTMGEPNRPGVTAEAVAADLARYQQAGVRLVFVLNKADDELRLQQAKQVSALLTETTAITVDGYVVWPNEQESGQ